MRVNGKSKGNEQPFPFREAQRSVRASPGASQLRALRPVKNSYGEAGSSGDSSASSAPPSCITDSPNCGSFTAL